MYMKQLFSLFMVTLGLLPVAIAQELELPRPSPKASVTQTIGLTDVTISYSRPGVKGRVIWGELVPYDKVWRTGANEATTISFSRDVKIGGQNIPAGAYSLLTIPGKEEWMVVINKDANQWGSYSYDQTKDAVRVKVKPQMGPHQERMMFSFADVQLSSGTVELAWEKVRVSFVIETDTVNQAMANIKDALESDWVVPYRAASFVHMNNVGDKTEARKWIDQSVTIRETYWNMRLKAEILAAEGSIKEAIAIAEKAVQIGKENKDEPGEVAKTENQIAEWKTAK
jgi:hypothetical protein